MPTGYKKGKPEIGYWLRQIRYGIQFRKEKANQSQWDLWRRYYHGDWAPGILPSPVFFKMLRTIVPRIYFRNPSISISPSMPGLEHQILAKLMERTDNKLIRAMRVKKHMKRIVQDAWMFGTGIGKKGFGSLYQSTPEPFGQTIQPDASKGAKTLRDFVEYNYDIQGNMPWFARWYTGDFIVPAGTEYIEDSRWTAFKVTRPVDDVERDPRLSNTKDIGAHREEIFDGRQSLNDIRRVDENTDLYEIHDKKTGMVFVISPNKDKPLLFEASEFARLKVEVASTLVFNDSDESFWGIPDAKILEPLQLEANEIKTYQMFHRRLSIARILAGKGALDEAEALKMVSPDVLPIVEVNGNPDQAIKILQGLDIPTGLLQMDQIVSQEIRETSGFGRNEFGEFRPGSRSPTATETRVVKESSELRVDERRDMVADMLVDIVSDFHPIIFNHWNDEQVEEIVGPAGIPFWINFRPSLLGKINYRVEVDPDQQVSRTKEVREEKAAKVYEILKTNPLIDPVRLTQYLLKELHGVQFDDMMKGLPLGAGLSPENPISVGQFGQVIQQTAQQNPQLISPGVLT